VVTLCGCGSGESSGGYEHTVRGSRDRGVRRCATSAMTAGTGPAATRCRFGRNAPNPTIGSGMQQARESSGTLNGVGKSGETPGDRRSKPTRPCETVRSERESGRQPGSEGATRTARFGVAPGRRTPGIRSMEGNGSNDPTNPRGGGRKPPTGADGPGTTAMSPRIGRRAKPTRAGLRSPTARWCDGDGFGAGNLEGPAG
jgi:hypothetical protein